MWESMLVRRHFHRNDNAGTRRPPCVMLIPSVKSWVYICKHGLPRLLPGPSLHLCRGSFCTGPTGSFWRRREWTLRKKMGRVWRVWRQCERELKKANNERRSEVKSEVRGLCDRCKTRIWSRRVLFEDSERGEWRDQWILDKCGPDTEAGKLSVVKSRLIILTSTTL